MPIVAMPDGTQVNFPDDIPSDQIKSMIASKFPDVAKGAVDPASIGGNTAAAVYGMSDMFPGLNKASDFLGAAGAKAYDMASGQNNMDGQSVLDLAKQAEADTTATQAANPIANRLGQVAGLVGSFGAFGGANKAIQGGVGAGLSALSQYAPAIAKGASMIAPLATGAAEGGTIGGAYGAGNAPIGQEMQGAENGAIAGAALGAAAPIAIGAVGAAGNGLANISKGIGALSPDKLQDISQSIKSESTKSYQTMRNVGAVIDPAKAQDIAAAVEGEISNSGKLNPRLHGDTLSVLDDLKTAAQGDNFGLEDLDQYRQLLRETVDNNTDITGKMSSDGRLAVKAINAIDDQVDNLTAKDLSNNGQIAVDALNKGRAQWAKYRSFDTVANIVKKADGDPNKIKSALTRFVNNGKNLRGFSPDEVDALKTAAKSSAGESVMKGLGRFGFDTKNAYLPIVGGGLATYGGGLPLGAALTAGGTLARYGAKYAARGKAQSALDLIASRPIN